MKKLMLSLLGVVLIGGLFYIYFIDKLDEINSNFITKKEHFDRVKIDTTVVKKDDNKSLIPLNDKNNSTLASNKTLEMEVEKSVESVENVENINNRESIKKDFSKEIEKTEEIVELEVKKSTEEENSSIDSSAQSLKKPVPKSVPNSENYFSCQDAFKDILLGEKINFEYNKADIKIDSYALLDFIVDIAKKCPKDAIEIGGHTDNIGSDSYNQKLSKNRAEAVKEYFIEQNISEDRLKAVGYGESQPIADNDTKEGREENRRIEFSVISLEDVKKRAEDEIELVEKTEEVNFDDIPLAKLIKLDEAELVVVKEDEVKEELFEPVTKSVWKRAFSCQEQFNTLLSNDKIYFSYNKAEVSPKSYALLEKLSKVGISCVDKVIYIGAHTDSDGDSGYNKRLSRQRAESIKAYFIKRGVPSDRLIAVGYGDTRPIASNNTDSGKAKNRRIEFYVKGVE